MKKTIFFLHFFLLKPTIANNRMRLHDTILNISQVTKARGAARAAMQI